MRKETQREVEIIEEAELKLLEAVGHFEDNYKGWNDIYAHIVAEKNLSKLLGKDFLGVSIRALHEDSIKMEVHELYKVAIAAACECIQIAAACHLFENSENCK